MNEVEIERTEKIPSTINMISYGTSGFWGMFTWTVFGSYVFFFYERTVGLPVEYIFYAMLIFTLWDAINDPLIGFLTDRILGNFTRKFGKRFPWIIIGIIPANFIFVLLFMPPPVNAATNPLPIFYWIIFSTCLFDTVTTLCFVNVNALFPDKFRTDKARRRAGGILTFFSINALPIATMIPPLMIDFDNQATFIPMAFICVAIIATISILFLPGMYENKELIDRYYVSKEKPEGFITALKSTLKQKSFVYYIILFFGFQVVTGSLTASIPYAVDIVLGGTETDTILLFASFLVGALISIPFWIMIAKKIKNNKKTAVIGGFSLVIGTFLSAFYTSVLDSMIYEFILGFSMGNFWALMTIYFADVLDERITLTRTDVRGTSVGVSSFFSRLSRGFQIAVFSIVHILTGFIEGQTAQSELAKFGVRLHMSVIPAIVLLICTIIYWKLYPITPKVYMENKQKLKELGF